MARPLFVVWALLVLAGFLASAPFPNGTVSRLAAALSVPESPGPVPGPSLTAVPRAWTAAARACGWAIVLAGAAWAAGRAAAPFLRLPGLRAAALPAAAGLVLCGTAVLGLGLAGLAFPAILAAGVLLIALAGAAAAAARGVPRGSGMPAVGIAGAVVAAAWVLAALNPEPGIDAYLYHLRLPFMYGLHHRIVRIWHHIHAQVPQVWEVMLAAVPAGDAAAAAQILSALAVVPVAALTIAFAGGAPGGREAMLLLVSSPLLVSIGTSAYTDLPLVWLGAASFALLVLPGPSPSPARRLAAGAVLGAACALKYAAFPLVAGAAAWLVAGSVRRRDAWWGVPVAAGAVAVMAPWLAWNWLAAGNPVDPFLGRWFPHALPALPFAERLSGAVFMRPWSNILASPWSAYVASEPFLFVSPWVVAAAPALVLEGRVLRALPGSGLWLSACVAAWAGLIADERFLLPAAPVAVALLARAGYARMPAAAFAALLALNLAGTFRQVLVPLPRLWASLGLVTRDDYMRGTLQPAPGYFEAAGWLNANTARKDRILVVSDCKSHLIWRECITDHVYDYPTRLVWILWGTPPVPGRIAARFRQLGVRWVLDLPGRSAARLAEMPDLFRFGPGEAIAWGGYWITHARLAWAGPGAAAYRVSSRTHPPGGIADLPGVRVVMDFSARLTFGRAGAGAAVDEVRKYAAAYPRVAAVRRLAGEVLTSVGRDPATRAEGRRELAEADRIDAAAGSAP